MCPAHDGIEDTEQFLLLCHSFEENRRNLLVGVNDILKAHGKAEGLNENILQILLYGDKDLPLEANKLILNLTVKYLFEPKRFAKDYPCLFIGQRHTSSGNV